MTQYSEEAPDLQPAAAGQPRLSPALRSQLDPLLNRHRIFGGRETELRRLNDFLTERDNGYLFITGLAGTGKTALLANWLRSLLQQDVKVCYHFISRLEVDYLADEDLVLRNLCQQLAAAHDLSGSLPAATTVLRSVYRMLLSRSPGENEKLVVILDGLDEAKGWTPGPVMFPTPLPVGVYVVFSVREIAQKDWLADLALSDNGVDTLELKTLDTSQIAHLLAATETDPADTAERALFAEVMHKTSYGEPFYLYYQIQDILSGSVTSVEDLKRQPKGLEAYLDNWWRELSQAAGEPAARDLLGYLLVARDRLTRSDLINLSVQDALDEWTIEPAIEQVRRYVVGNEVSGYSLCQPRFQKHVAQARLRESTRQLYGRRLLHYCARWREHKSSYALSHYARHLVETGHKRGLYLLIDRPWLEAGLERYQAPRTFANDVELAISAAADETPASLVQLVRGCLIYSLLGSVATSIPSLLLGVLALVGQGTRARAYASLIQDREKQSDAYRLIGEGLLVRKEVELAKKVLGQGLEIATTIIDKEAQVRVLGEFANALVQARAFDQAVAAAEALRDDEDKKVQALSRVAVVAAQIGEFDQAVAIAKTIEPAWATAKTLNVVVQIIAKTEDYDRALQVADAIEDEGERAKALGKVVRIMAENGAMERVGATAREAVATAVAMEDERDKEHALTAVGETLAEAGEYDQALVAAEAMENEFAREWWVLPKIAQVLAEAGDYDRALAAVEAIEVGLTKQRGLSAVTRAIAQAAGGALGTVEPLEDGGAKSRLLQELAQARVQERVAAQADEVLVATGAIKRKQAKAEALSELAQSLAQVGLTERAAAVAGETLTTAAALEDEKVKTEVRGQLAPIFAAAGEVDRARTVIEMIGDGHVRGDALRQLVQELVNRGQYEQALEVAEAADAKDIVARLLVNQGKYEQAFAKAEAIGTEQGRAWTLGQLVRFLVSKGRYDQALAKAEAIEVETVRAEALGHIAQTLVRAGAKKRAAAVAGQGVSAAKASEDGWAKNKLLNKLAQVLAQAGAYKQAFEALAVIEDERSRTNAWPELARFLAEVGEFDQAVAAAAVIENPDTRVESLSEVAQFMAQGGVMERAQVGANDALAQLELVKNEEACVMVLGEVARITAQAGHFDQALLAAAAIGQTEAKAGALCEVAQALAQARFTERAAATATEALLALTANDAGQPKADTTRIVAQALARTGQPDRALTTVELIDQKWARQRALAEVAQALVEAGHFEAALTAVAAVKEERTRVEVLHEVVQALAESGQVDLALATLESIEDTGEHAEVRSEIAQTVARAGDFDRALSIVAAIKQESSRADPLCAIAQVMVEAGEYERALATFETIQLELVDVWTLPKVAHTVALTGDYDRALGVLKAMRPGKPKDWAVCEVAVALARANETGQAAELAAEALEVAEAERLWPAKLRVLRKLAQARVLSGLTERVTAAASQELAIAVQINGEAGRVRVLRGLVEYLIEAGELEQALGTAEALEDAEAKARALSQVARALFEAGRHKQALEALQSAFTTARFAGPEHIVQVLDDTTAVMAAIDQGQTLGEVCRTIADLGRWWGRIESRGSSPRAVPGNGGNH